MRFLFITDPWDALDPEGDTTYAFMTETARRGHECHTARIAELSLVHDKARVCAHETSLGGEDSVVEAEGVDRPMADFDAVFMRKDPPVDVDYLQATWILDAAKEETLVVNDPRGLRELNEHLSILRYPDLIPRTLVTRDVTALRRFLDEQGGQVVVKPVDGYGGRGIFVLKKGDPNLSSLLEAATDHGAQWTMAQEYLPAATEGDKRILLVDGEPIGAVLRVPGKNEARGNLHVGGTAEKTELTEREIEIVGRLAPMMREYGVLFAGIDVIGDTLTEINITSPTGIRHLDQLHGGASAGRVIDCVESKVTA